ncbi:MAG: SRPBCC family protein [Rhodoplanes sp.]|uniref:SRPBCC family protein n=1 Tax=Rhodoplanes sp. TaxID=1968906 RepID=UPI0017BB7E81|nr:SRPBCC family protein [Rhodoplanes sp.]NVO15722.1 SRPBCC family protein [Rhodoplanes sp.]
MSTPLSTTDRIEKTIEIAAPVSRVWRALIDHEAFGAWFRVKLDGPFVVGAFSRGHVTYPGYEHVRWTAQVRAIEPERRFAFAWHPYAIDPGQDYSGEEPTLVEFTLEPIATGTRLTVVESGFDKVPAHRRDEAFRMNDRGWGMQVENIARYVAETVGSDGHVR